MAEKVHDGKKVVTAGLSNIGAIEVLSIRRFFVESMASFEQLTSVSDAGSSSNIIVDNQGIGLFNSQNDYGGAVASTSVARPLRTFRVRDT